MSEIPKSLEQEITAKSQTPVSDWVKAALDRATPLTVLPHEKELAEILVAQAFEAHQNLKINFGVTLAAAFDLFVAAEYYKSVANKGWYYCPQGTPILYFPFTNVCPRCVLKGNFNFESANKPESGSIGQASSRLLAVFFRTTIQKVR